MLPGSAEHLPLADRSVDVVHARFAYFLAPASRPGGGDAGLAEVMRVLTPGGRLVVVDNDYRWGEFAELLAAASKKPPQQTADAIDGWWRRARRHPARGAGPGGGSQPRGPRRGAEHRGPGPVARAWLARNPAATGLSYGYVLFAVTRSGRV